jgi:hypothetical protein
MTSTSDAAVGGDERQVRPGRQELVSLSSMDSALSVLPPKAAENLLLLSPASPKQVELNVIDSGLELDSVGLVPISSTNHGYDGPLWTTQQVAPSDLTGLSMRFAEAVQHLTRGTGWVVFDSLNVLLMYADESHVYRLVDHLIRENRDRNLRGVYTVVREAIGQQTYATLQRRFDEPTL